MNWWGRGVGGVDYLVVGHVDLFYHFQRWWYMWFLRLWVLSW